MNRGFGTVEVTVALIVVALTAAALLFTYNAGERAGTAEERAAWQKRELVQQQTYAAEIDRLRKEKDAQLGALQMKLAQADTDYQKKREEAAREKSKNDRFERGLRDGRIVLVDPGAGQAGGSPGGTGAATAGGCDGAQKPQPRGLSGELSAFLWAEAGRADELITDLVDQLELAQNAALAYYEMAKACQSSGSR